MDQPERTWLWLKRCGTLQRGAQQDAYDSQLQKARLQWALFKLQIDFDNTSIEAVSDGTAWYVKVKPAALSQYTGTLSFIKRIDVHRQQTQLDKVIAKRQRIAAKMKQEQAEAQQFCKMMRSHQLQQDQTIAALQQNVYEVPKHLLLGQRLQDSEQLSLLSAISF